MKKIEKCNPFPFLDPFQIPTGYKIEIKTIKKREKGKKTNSKKKS